MNDGNRDGCQGQCEREVKTWHVRDDGVGSVGAVSMKG